MVLHLQGDVTAIYSEDGKELATYTYDAWGNVTGITGDEILAKSNPWRYRGYYFDEELGMYYNQSRYIEAILLIYGYIRFMRILKENNYIEK